MNSELLLPAGNIDSLKRAVMCGADAVYLGLDKFNARASAENFNSCNLSVNIDLCHLYGVKVYVAFNTAIKDSELSEAERLIKVINDSKADGIIISDIGLIPIINKVASNLPIHISTQAGAHNSLSAEFFYRLGADRIVLARESDEQDIRDIKKNIDIDMEYFVQGALCVSFSGGCLFSSIIHNCSGNRGACLQPCRQKYTLRVNDREQQGYMLSTSDLCLLNKLDKLEDMGITSFKIEGRMRRAEYVAQSALSYRKVMDKQSDYKTELPYLKRAFNRGDYSEGYIYSNDNIMSTRVQGHMGEYCGKVIETFKKSNYHYAEVESIIELTQGDGLKILRNGNECGGADLHSVEVKGKGRYIIPVSANAQTGDKIYLTTDKNINQELNNIVKRMDIDINCKAKLNEPLSINLKLGEIKAVFVSDYIVPNSIKAPTTENEIILQLSKLNDTEFKINSINITSDNNIFIPKSQLNELRRQGIDRLKLEILKNYKPSERKNKIIYPIIKVKDKECNKVLIVEISDINQILDEAIKLSNIVVINPDMYEIKAIRELVTLIRRINNCSIYLSLPRMIRYADRPLVEEICNYLLEQGVGILADNYSSVQLARDKGINYIAGIGLNIYNLKAMELLADADYHILSPELEETEAKPLLDKGAILYALGNLPLMTISHCPVKLVFGTDCKNCKYTDEISYTDNKCTFKAKRSKLNKCSFTIYNSLPHNLSNRVIYNQYNLYLNMYGYNDVMCDKILSTISKSEAVWLEKCTGGNYIRNSK